MKDNDLISRQAATEVIYKALKTPAPDYRKDPFHDTMSLAVAMAKEIPSEQPEQRWTPCSERLPKKHGRYLVTRGLKAAGSLWNRVYIANHSDLMKLASEPIFYVGNVGKNDFERLDDVIAWQPLPEPYQQI